MEPIASLVICFFIVKAAVDIFREAINKMVDHACSAETEKTISECASAQSGVMWVDKIMTREFGNRIYVDIEICVDPLLTLKEAHEIAERVHDAIETNFTDVKHVMVRSECGTAVEEIKRESVLLSCYRIRQPAPFNENEPFMLKPSFL